MCMLGERSHIHIKHRRPFLCAHKHRIIITTPGDGFCPCTVIRTHMRSREYTTVTWQTLSPSLSQLWFCQILAILAKAYSPSLSVVEIMDRFMWFTISLGTCGLTLVNHSFRFTLPAFSYTTWLELVNDMLSVNTDTIYVSMLNPPPNLSSQLFVNHTFNRIKPQKSH